MKKLSIILLALAMAACAVPAFAGDVSITGDYTLDAESFDWGDLEQAWYDDEFQAVIKISQGSVTGVIDLEVSDDETFDGTNKSRANGEDDGALDELVDNYWLEWQAMDALKVKAGEYGLSFGSKVLIYAKPAAHHIGLTYSLDQADLGLYIGKVDEGARNDPDDDIDSISLLVNVKGVDFFKKLNFLFVTEDDQSDNLLTYTGLDTAFSVGPVAVAFEYGSVASDDATYDGGDFILAQFGLDELLGGYDVNIDYFSSGEEFFDTMLSGDGGDFYPYMIVTFRSGVGGNLNDLNLIGISGSYKVNDKVTLSGKILASGDIGLNDDDLGMEIDAHLKYQFADNVSATFTAATWDGGDVSDDDATDLRARFVFKF